MRVRIDVVRDNEVIEETDFNEPQSIDQATGDQIVRGTRSWISAWMVMVGNERVGSMSKCRLDDLPRVDGGAVDSPAKEIFDGNESGAHIEMKNAEHLMIERSQM